MSGYNYLKGSDGTGLAVLAHITAPRAIGATVLEVDSLDNWPDEFVVVTGELNSSGFLIPSSMTEMLAHQLAGDIIIDGFAPGYSDVGNTTSPAQVAVIKPTTHIIDSLVENAQEEHHNDGKHSNVTADSVKVAGVDVTQQSLYENAIINAGCRVAQRVAQSLTTSFKYGQVDRFAVKGAGTAVSAGSITQNTSALVASQRSAEIKVSGVTITGAGVLHLRYRMEAKDAVMFKNQVASFGCRVYHDVGAAVNATIYIRKPTVADNFASTTDIANSGAISIPNATATALKFENINAGDLGDCSNGLEIEIQISCGAVTLKNFSFGDFIFNKGAKAGTYQPLRYEADLAAAMRYYFAYCIGETVRGIGSVYVGGGQSWATIPTPVPLRGTPTISINSLTARYNGTDVNFTSISVVNTLPAGINVTGLTSGTGNGNTATSWTNAGTITLDSEL